jgi:hypothetical protein
MYHNHAHGDEHRGRRRARLRRAGLLAAALACLALVAAACSSPAGPGAGAGSAKHSELAYSRCMRAHGIKAFPDPNAQGELALNEGPGTGIDPKSPQFKAADNACKSLLPPRKTLSPAQQAAAKAQALKYSQCMRAHGISDFPDPDSQGNFQVQGNAGSDLDPHNPRFQAAGKACQHDLPGGGKGGSFNSSGSGGGS